MAQQIAQVGFLRREVVLEFPYVRQKVLHLSAERELRQPRRQGGVVPAVGKVVHEDAEGAREERLRDRGKGKEGLMMCKNEHAA